MAAALPARLLRAARPLPWSDAPIGRQWAGVLAAWGLAAAASLTRYSLGPGPDSLPAVLARLPIWLACYATWVAATPALAAVVWRYPLDRPAGATRAGRMGSVLRRVPAYAAVGTAATLAATFGGNWLSATYARWSGVPWQGGITPLDYFMESIVCVSALGVLTAAARWHEARRRELEVADLTRVRLELESELRDAQLQALRMKVNPHFLFNALQTVAALVRADPAAAERTLARVGDVLRMALRLDLSTEIPLKQELEVASAYLDLEKVRFRERLRVELDVEPGLADALVPSLILQPLVENAIRHGVGRQRGAAVLRIEARTGGNQLALAVTDDGPGFAPVGPGSDGPVREGIGLETVRSRLEKLYPGAASFTLRNRPEGGVAAEILLPLRRAESRSGHAA